MGDRRSHAAALTGRRRGWPVVVRRATHADRDAVVSFASQTFEGWDYIPHAWPVWLDAEDGVLLVAVPGDLSGGRRPHDADGAELPAERPVAVARVAIVSPTEAWLEGIRVDPRVRGLDVATDLQVAELHWAAAQGAHVIRYATGERNEGSHRLGARHDFSLLVVFRSWLWSATGSAESGHNEPSAYEPDVRASTTMRRQALLDRLATTGAVAAPSTAADLWLRLDADETFNIGHRLYEPRPWAMQELTRDLFMRHVERGELLVGQRPAAGGGELAGRSVAIGGWSVAIVVREQLPAEDGSLRLALLAGEGESAAQLADLISQQAAETIRFRLPEDAPLIAPYETAFAAAGFVKSEWLLHVLGRTIAGADQIPMVDPTRLVLADQPRPILRSPEW